MVDYRGRIDRLRKLAEQRLPKLGPKLFPADCYMLWLRGCDGEDPAIGKAECEEARRRLDRWREQNPLPDDFDCEEAKSRILNML